MFSGLRSNNAIYILEKGEKPTLKVGQVISVSNPMPKVGALPYSAETYVDVSAKVDDSTVDFKQLPSSVNITNNGNVVVSDSRDAMLNEVEGMKRVSEEVLKSVDYHQNVVEACEAMLSTLNPSIAERKATDARIGALEEQMGGMNDTLVSIKQMLTNALNTTNKKS